MNLRLSVLTILLEITMNKVLNLALLLAAPSMLLANGTSSSTIAKAKVNIVAPISLCSTQDLDFGSIIMQSYATGGSVTMVSNTGNGSAPIATLQGFEHCSVFPGSAKPTAAFFHFMKDKRYDVNIIIDKTVDMGDGVKLTTNNDLPADNCGVFPHIAGTHAKHFSVAGKLDIPAKVFGRKEGVIHVTVAYK